MGLFLSKLVEDILSASGWGGFTKEKRIVMIGLDNGGKSTILYRLKIAELAKTVPTVGFNVETVEYKNISFTIWDVGGQDKLRALWRYYYEGTDAIIFVVDSSDKDRISIARDELHKVVGEQQLRQAKLLILANKQDLPNCLTAKEVVDKLDLPSIHSHEWFVQTCVATTGHGLYEGFDWLHNAVMSVKS